MVLLVLKRSIRDLCQHIFTDDQEGLDCELELHVDDLHVLISTPFHPAYVTAERIKKAKNLELLLTAGVGSDHIDLKAAAAAGLTVAEVTGSNVVSVAEDELMRILILVRNFLPAYHQAKTGEWNVAEVAHRAYDLEGKTVGTVGAGRIGRLLLQRLKPFNCNLLYHDRVKMEAELEEQIGAKFEEDLDAMLPKCDVIVINTPLTDQPRGLFDKNRIAKCKKGVLIVNNARGAIMDTQAVADACSSGHIAVIWIKQKPIGKKQLHNQEILVYYFRKQLHEAKASDKNNLKSDHGQTLKDVVDAKHASKKVKEVQTPSAESKRQ
ncbi:formate dehydrogenase, mitochondrial-like [Gastrolobium bilobum]|uniref:formate dehydrogenase, mitochondrial-like n=1 Tax=Gastrolobium bilobum TaxID=150636 RepID=UPI002AB108D7|nr:formate dehydrogenase, mitochondrial-like [Gastrolobium bilobum]